MYDIASLEAQWKKYKTKRMLLPVFLVLSIVAILYAVYALSSQNLNDDSSVTAKLDNPASANKQEEKDSVKLTPTANTNLSPEVPSVAKTEEKKGWNIDFSGSPKEPAKQVRPTPTKHIDIKVSTKKSQVTIGDMEDRFATSNDKDDALFISRYYYDKKQYKKALKWALEVNKIDSGIEESWLIFSRSKAKLGSRAEAIRILQAYHNRSGSKKAKDLLGKIRRGKGF